MKKFFISSMIVLLYVAYTSIMPVHAQNEVSVQKQNIYNSISDIADILLQHGADINKNLTELRSYTLRHRFLKMKSRYC